MGQEMLAHGGSGGRSRAEAERLLAIAEKLLVARDLVGSKKFAERAMDSDPLLDGVDQILAIADVLLASQRRMNNHVDLYSVLQIEPFSADISTVKHHYRRLALLLHPDKNRCFGADHAFKLVVDAWSILSDPSKKALFDRELSIATAHLKSNGGGHDDLEKQKTRHWNESDAVFWTACPQCYNVYQYVREYEGRSLRCQNCRKAFHATEMPSPPPVVPGTDMYYCSWGLMPLGFPGGPVFDGVPNRAGKEPWSSQHEIGSGKKQSLATETPDKGNMVRTRPVSANTSKKKKVAVRPPKKQTAPARKEGSGVDINVEPRNDTTIEIAEGADVGCSQNAGVMGDTLDMNRFIIDIDATDDVLGNLSNLPFLKPEEHYARPSLFDG